MRLIDDMMTEAGRLERRASGFKMAGDSAAAIAHRTAAIALRDAAKALEGLKA